MLAQITDPVTLETLVRLIPATGVTGVMACLIWMLLTGKLITKREHDKLQAAHDKWQDIALRSVRNNETLTGIADRTAGAAEKIVSRSTQ